MKGLKIGKKRGQKEKKSTDDRQLQHSAWVCRCHHVLSTMRIQYGAVLVRCVKSRFIIASVYPEMMRTRNLSSLQGKTGDLVSLSVLIVRTKSMRLMMTLPVDVMVEIIQKKCFEA
jgi:hypothetical protein